jgi:hypothetical protein
MHRQNRMRILATAATLAAVTAPCAHASAIGGGGGGQVSITAASEHTAPTRHHSTTSDWELIAIAGGGTVAFLGAGLGASRRRARGHAPARNARPAGVS